MVSMAIASMWASITSWFTPSILFCAANLIIATIFIASNNQTKHNDHNHNHNHGHEDLNCPPTTRISRVSSFLERARSFKLSSYSTSTIAHVEPQYQYPPESKTPTYSSTSRLAQSIHLPSELSHGTDELYPSEPETYPLSQPAHSPSLFERVKSIKFSSDSPGQHSPSLFERVKSIKFSSDSPGQLDRPPSFIERVRSFRISYGSTQPESADPNPDPDLGHNPEQHVIRSKSEKTAKAKKSSMEMKKSRSEMRLAASDDEEDVDLRRPATARVRGSHDVDEEVDAKADDFISRFKQQLKLQRLESLVRYNQKLNRSS